MTIEYESRTSVRQKSLVMLPDQIFDAVSRSVSIGGGSKSLLTHPPFAAIHQIAINKIGPIASSTARRNLLVFSFDSVLRMSAPALPEKKNVAWRLRLPTTVWSRLSSRNQIERKCRVVQRCVHLCILK